MKYFLGLYILFFCVGPQANAAEIPEIDSTYGERVMATAWRRLSIDFHSYFFDVPEYGITPWEHKEVLEPIAEFYHYKFNDKVLEYRPGTDPMFRLHPDEPPRTAVTGTSLDSKIFVNLERINDRTSFRYSNALGLIIHEFGHKIKPFSHAGVTQEDIDRVSQKVSVGASTRESIFSLGKVGGEATELYLVNTYNFNQERHINRTDYEKLLPVLWIIRANQVFPLENWIFSWFMKEQRNPDPKTMVNRALIVESLDTAEVSPQKFRVLARTHHHVSRGADIYQLNIPSVVMAYFNLGVKGKKIDVTPARAFQVIEGAPQGRSIPISVEQKLVTNSELVLEGKADFSGLKDTVRLAPSAVVVDVTEELRLEKAETLEEKRDSQGKLLSWSFRLRLPWNGADKKSRFELLGLRTKIEDKKPCPCYENQGTYDLVPKSQVVIGPK